MDARQVFLICVLQSFFQLVQMVSNELDRPTRQNMAQRQMDMSLQMDRLLQELESRNMEMRIQKHSGFAWEVLLVAALKEWHFWAPGLLICLCYWLRGRSSHHPASHGKEGTSRNEADKEEQEAAASPALPVHIVSAMHIDHTELFTLVEHMVNELLYICGDLSKNSFMPRLKPVIPVGSALRGWNSCEEDTIYHLLLPLDPPHGHTFHLETGTTTKDMPARSPCLRVGLQCTCTTEELEKDMLCFLHHPKGDLKEKQGLSLLSTLCTGPYLDMEKTSCWLQILLKRAWTVSRHSRKWRLTVPHSRHSCNLRLMDSCHSAVLIHLMFGVQQGDSITILSIE